MYSNTLVHLEHLKNLESSLNSIATVVDLSKGNSYKLLVLVTSLFMWSMSGVPRVFDVKCVLVMGLFVWCATCG